MIEFLQSASFRRLLLSLCGIAIPALNNKLGLSLSETQIAELLAFVAAIVVTSKAGDAHVAGKEAAATVKTIGDAKAVFAEPAPVAPEVKP